MIRAALFLGFLFSVAVSEKLEDDGLTGELSSNCIRCICEVVGCRDEMTCSENNVCGPFRITQIYWTAAFNQNNTNQEEFQQCTLNAHCATQTVLSYMRRFLPKCVSESNTRPVCETALSLHFVGHHQCSRAGVAPQTAALRACHHRRAPG